MSDARTHDRRTARGGDGPHRASQRGRSRLGEEPADDARADARPTSTARSGSDARRESARRHVVVARVVDHVDGILEKRAVVAERAREHRTTHGRSCGSAAARRGQPLRRLRGRAAPRFAAGRSAFTASSASWIAARTSSTRACCSAIETAGIALEVRDGEEARRCDGEQARPWRRGPRPAPRGSRPRAAAGRRAASGRPCAAGDATRSPCRSRSTCDCPTWSPP